MLKSRHPKRLTALLLGAVFALTACGNKEKPMPPYDASTRVPTDANEIAVTVNESDYEYYNNYIEFTDGEGDVYDIGDPFVFRHDGKYYLYTSLNGSKRFAGRIPCWSSENLVDWEWAGWAYQPDAADMTGGRVPETYPTYIAFAPEVVYYKGWFYMCESRRGQGHYFFRSAQPNGPFERISDNLGMGIDGSFHLTDSGDLYFLSAEDETANRICWYDIDFIEEGGSVRVQIDNVSTNVVSDAYLGGWTEGPGVFGRNGYEYMTYAGNHVDAAQYRVAYSFSAGGIDYEADTLKSKFYNNTLVSTGIDNPAVPGYAGSGNTAVSDFRGLGHSSNVTGPNMDSVYTAFHNAGRVNHKNVSDNSGGTRKYNVTQYFTNEGYLLTNGLGNYTRPKPALPDYSASASELTLTGDFMLGEKSSGAVFTAEISFRLADGKGSAVAGYTSPTDYREIAVDGETLVYARVSGGRRELGRGTVSVSTNPDAVHTIRLVNGADKLEIYYDNILVVTSSDTVPAGRLGCGAGVTTLAFTDDAFGTSDFDAVKDLTGSFPAYTYMKGENRGWQIAGAKVRASGLRQGERESTRTVQAENVRTSDGTASTERVPATAVTLRRGDWVKYLVNAPADDVYALNMLVGRQSAGCVFEVIVDNTAITMLQMPGADAFGDADFVNLSAGSFTCGSGLHTLKIRVYDGTLDVVNFSTVRGGAAQAQSDALTTAENSVFKKVLGNNAAYTLQNGLMTSPNDAKTVFMTGSKGAADFEMSVSVVIPRAGVGGILFRTEDYSYANASTVQQEGWRGYYLALSSNLITLTKHNYTRVEQLGLARPTVTLGVDKVKVTIRAEGGKIAVSLNNVEQFAVFDPEAYVSGYTMLYTVGTMMIFSDYTYQPI